LKFTILRRENSGAALIFLDFEPWTLGSGGKVWRTFGLSAPLFINSGDFLQIEIYYIKKRKFWSCTNISGF